MKNKNLLGVFLGLCFILLLPSKALAGKDIQRDKLLKGLKEINYQTTLLRESRAIKYEKLAKDLEEFQAKGSASIDSNNMFYLLNTDQFDANELENGIKDTGLAGLGKDFKAAENESGVNAILLMAMAKHETGNGTSQLFREKNNLFGFNAYDDDPYNKASTFADPGQSIKTVAEHLRKSYLDPKGAYYRGISTDGIGQSYATDPDWAKKVNWMMIEVGEKMIDEFNKKID